MPTERTVWSTLEQVAEDLETQFVRPPAIVVVGEVVAELVAHLVRGRRGRQHPVVGETPPNAEERCAERQQHHDDGQADGDRVAHDRLGGAVPKDLVDGFRGGLVSTGEPSQRPAHVEAVVRLLPTRYRLPALVLDATGMRIGELERLTWGDVDEPRQRWRVSAAVAKTGRARWVPVRDVLFEAVTALVPREDRISERPIFQGFGAERFRTAIARACAAGDCSRNRSSCRPNTAR